jgi:hypothetical protein
MRCSKVNFEIGPSLVRCFLLVPPVAGAHEVACGKDIGISHVYLLRMANFHASCLRKFSTILSLLEKGLHWLLRVPCLTYLLEIVLQINSSDAAISEKQVFKHLSGRDVCKAYHVVIQDVKVHWLKNSDDLFLKCLLYSIKHI